ncbi:MAG: Uncharacterized protein LiPW16_50 [Microgenomates group bacterium LiPW_16]|nr:MAG: Uncharacterized protein LiPW16_50 [Microgenomates group bacterium LiPW_16]
MRSDFDFVHTYSKSRLELFKTCKKAYHFSYVDEIISPNKREYKKAWDFKTLGQAVHNAITLFYHLEPEKRTLEQLKKLLPTCWKSEIMKRKNPPLGKYGGFESIDHERAKYKEALGLLQNFFKIGEITAKPFYLPTDDLDNSINDYFDWAVPLANTSFKLSGKIDRIDELGNGNLKVVDFKTGGKSDNNFQLKLYKFLIEKRFGKLVEKASFYYLKDSTVENFDLLKEDLGKIEEEILAKINEILSEKKFEARVSKLCKFCDFLEICPANTKAWKIIKKSPKEEYSDNLPF